MAAQLNQPTTTARAYTPDDFQVGQRVWLKDLDGYDEVANALYVGAFGIVTKQMITKGFVMVKADGYHSSLIFSIASLGLLVQQEVPTPADESLPAWLQ